jgi:sterol desaturase/sphingolipid hydroxylase (fatty acid hydroxylase superfamily)
VRASGSVALADVLPASVNGEPSDPAREAAPDGRAVRTGAWFGVVVLASFAVWLGVIGWQALSRAGNLAAAIRGAQGQMVGPALLVVVGVLVVAERLWPAVPRPLLSRAHLVDAGYLALLAVIVGPLVTLVDTGFAVTIDRHAHFLLLRRLPFVPQVVVAGLILIGIDAINWLAHFNNHRSAALWRLHALHHSQEDMNVFTTFRTHPLAHASYLPAIIPALFLGASGSLPSAALIAYGCFVTLPHANLKWTLGPFGKIVVSPAYHRLHHASTPVNDRRAVNFGFVLVCWDRLAGCAVSPAGGPPIQTGIAGRPVPIEQTGPTVRVPRVVAAQLAQPFRRTAGAPVAAGGRR